VSNEAFGVRRICTQLRLQEIVVNHKRIRRLMRLLGIKEKGAPRRKITTTDSNHTETVAQNLLGRKFTVNEPNLWWVGDITFVWTEEGWGYLSIVLDLFSRRIVGWSLSCRIDSCLVEESLKMAVEARNPLPSLSFHSDRGSQYCSANFKTLLASHKIRQSMSRKGNCYDNSVAESFFRSLKVERLHGIKILSLRHASDIISCYINDFYNLTRPHSFLLYKSPISWEFETSLNPHLVNLRNHKFLK
jgi:putative transposase